MFQPARLGGIVVAICMGVTCEDLGPGAWGDMDEFKTMREYPELSLPFQHMCQVAGMWG